MSERIYSVLTKEDVDSPTWKRIRARLERRLEELRAKNDRPASVEETAATRGKIAEIKFLLTMDSPSPAIVTDEDEF